MLGLRVVSVASGERPGLGASVVRELGYYVDGLFFGMVGKAAMDSSPHKQRHGDGWAGTTVVRRATLNTAVAGGAGRVALGLLAYFVVHSTVMAACCVALAFMR